MTTALQKRAQAKFRRLQKLRRDPRYKKVLGQLAHEQLLTGNHIIPIRGAATVDDALWVGAIEPRVLELLPAILVRRPRLFLQARPLPEDLAQVVRELRVAKPQTTFRGIAPNQYAQWLNRIGRGSKLPAILKAHRFTRDDLEVLNRLKMKWGVDETAAIRRALFIAAKAI